MRSGELRQPAFALGPAVEELPDADGLLEAALPWIAGLCFVAAILLAQWDGARCETGDEVQESAALGTLAPILSSGRPANAPDRPGALTLSQTKRERDRPLRLSWTSPAAVRTKSRSGKNELRRAPSFLPSRWRSSAA